ncbi:MAG: cobyrinate a,c-diamide synthase, partial [Rhodospirillales bacterium]
MRPALLDDLVRRLSDDSDIIICEGVMGLFDGAAGGGGSTADIAARTGWPVVLVVDVRGMAASVAAIVRGFAGHRDDLRLAGVIFNRVASDRHVDLLTAAVRDGCPDVAVLGGLRRRENLGVPSRHLGLVQAGEAADLQRLLEDAAAAVAEDLDIPALAALAGDAGISGSGGAGAAIPPLGQHIAVARDMAFAFTYPHVLDGWRKAGSEVTFFSPLAGEGPSDRATAVYLPGGYPELHAGPLAASQGFRDGMRVAAGREAVIYGECGGYMVLGNGLTDAAGDRHRMLDLLPLETSFATPRRRLGYRRVTLLDDGPLGPEGSRFRAHEFHYSAEENIRGGNRLFRVSDATGTGHGLSGLVQGRVFGSYIHLIDRE